MLLLSNFYLKYFFFLTKNVHFLWQIYNTKLINWNIKSNLSGILYFYKPVFWVYNITAELESFVIAYFFIYSLKLIFLT